MPFNRRPILISCLVLVLTISVGFCLVTLLALGSLFIPGKLTSLRPGPLPTPFNLDTLPTPAGESSASVIPDDLLAEMKEIQVQVIAERNLLPTHEIPRAFLTPAELGVIVEEDMFADYSEDQAFLDGMVLAYYGLVHPTLDLLQFYEEMYSEQIAGFYDQETGEMFVVKGKDFGPNDRLTYAHEYTHVLQDQTFGLADNLNFSTEGCSDDLERCAAVQSLLEGDASLLEYRWQDEHFSQQDFRDWLSTALTMQFPVLDQAPPYFEEDLLFPYLYGYNFVSDLYDRGGWDAVNAAYANPPVSTEQIMHPERYPTDKPELVTIPINEDELPGSYELFDEGDVGEWFTYLYLAHGVDPQYRLESRVAKRAARGWGGGSYKLYGNSDYFEAILVTCNIWDTPEDALEFQKAFTQYGNSSLAGHAGGR